MHFLSRERTLVRADGNMRGNTVLTDASKNKCTPHYSEFLLVKTTKSQSPSVQRLELFFHTKSQYYLKVWGLYLMKVCKRWTGMTALPQHCIDFCMATRCAAPAVIIPRRGARAGRHLSVQIPPTLRSRTHTGTRAHTRTEREKKAEN